MMKNITTTQLSGCQPSALFFLHLLLHLSFMSLQEGKSFIKWNVIGVVDSRTIDHDFIDLCSARDPI